MRTPAAFVLILMFASVVFAASEEEFLKQGYKKSASGDYQGAVKQFKQAARMNPHSFEAHKGMGTAYFQLGINKAAVSPAIIQDSIASLSEAIRIRPEAETYYYIGMAQLALGLPDDAEIHYQKLVQLDRIKGADLAAKIVAFRESKTVRYRADVSASPKERGVAPCTKKGSAVAESQSMHPKTERFTGTVEIYVTNWCRYCKQAERYLKRKGIPYVAYDIDKDSAARQRHKELGGRGVPLIIIGSNRMSGFSPASLEYYMNNSR